MDVTMDVTPCQRRLPICQILKLPGQALQKELQCHHEQCVVVVAVLQLVHR